MLRWVRWQTTQLPIDVHDPQHRIGIMRETRHVAAAMTLQWLAAVDVSPGRLKGTTNHPPSRQQTHPMISMMKLLTHKRSPGPMTSLKAMRDTLHVRGKLTPTPDATALLLH